MQRASVLAAPGVEAIDGDSEGLPAVLCEAQAEGLPVTTFDTEGVTEALPVKRRHALPKAGNVAALAEEIIRIMRDEQAWQKASDAGRSYMRSHFDLDAQTQLLEDKYEEVIARLHA